MTAAALSCLLEPALKMGCFIKVGASLLTAAELGRWITDTGLALVAAKQDDLAPGIGIIAKLALWRLWCGNRYSFLFVLFFFYGILFTINDDAVKKDTGFGTLFLAVETVSVALASTVEEPLAAVGAGIKVELWPRSATLSNIYRKAAPRIIHSSR